jgi:hypothetical protein
MNSSDTTPGPPPSVAVVESANWAIERQFCAEYGEFRDHSPKLSIRIPGLLLREGIIFVHNLNYFDNFVELVLVRSKVRCGCCEQLTSHSFCRPALIRSSMDNCIFGELTSK